MRRRGHGLAMARRGAALAVVIVLIGSIAPLSAAPASDAPRAGLGGVSGTVLDGDGIPFDSDHLPLVVLYDAHTFDAEWSDEPNSAGQYGIGGVPSGDYYVTFFGFAPDGEIGAYPENYDDSVTYYHATVVTVTEGNVSGIDAELDREESCSTLTTGPYPDVTSTSELEFCNGIEWVTQAGIAEGFADGLFHPGGAVTRQAMAAFIFRFLGDTSYVPPSTPTFDDVPLSHPFFREIEWLAESGIAEGFPDGGFHPGANIARQAMSAFLYRAAGEPAFTPPAVATFPDVPPSHVFFAEVEWMASYNITRGFSDGTFRPANATTRRAMSYYLLTWDAVASTFDE